MTIFAAIDFETANYSPGSACSIGIVRVEHGKVVAREHRLIRPPSDDFFFTDIHGLEWHDVKDEPAFAEVWQEIRHLCEGVDFIAAHNAEFDRKVLEACCEDAGLPMPSAPFQCTVRLARRTFGIYPTTLKDVAAHLHIPLQHHHAMSDAEACAQIVLRAGERARRHAMPAVDRIALARSAARSKLRRAS